MKKYFVCEYCGYWWKEPDEEHERCHCPDDGFPAPCEYEDDYEYVPDDDYDDYDFED